MKNITDQAPDQNANFQTTNSAQSSPNSVADGIKDKMKTPPRSAPTSTKQNGLWNSYESYKVANAETAHLSEDQLNEKIEEEFQSSPLAEEDGKDGWARREFLKLMGASLAMSSVACVRRPVQRIVPYSKAPLEIIPGVANHYASSLVMGGEGYGLLVRTREGRPLKMEGNPAHPLNLGALNARAQGFLLGLYDPDRLQKPQRIDRNTGTPHDVAWEDIDKEFLKSAGAGGEVAVLTPSLGSPSTQQLITDFTTGFKGRHVVWDAISYDDVTEGQRLSYGKAVLPRYNFEKSRMTVSIDCDFLGTFASPVGNAKRWAQSRKPGQDMASFVAFESVVTITGASADTRVRIKPSQQLDVVLGLLGVLVNKGLTKYSGQSNVKSLVAGSVDFAKTSGNIEPALFEKIAMDLWEHRGRSIVIAGGLQARTDQALALQVAVNLLNSALENDGKTIDGSGVVQKSFEGSNVAMAQLITDMKAGKIGTLIIHRTNPVYALPADSGFVEALKNVRLVISTSDRVDETAQHADFIAPDVHELENWGDHEILTGVFSIQQPLIRPLYDNSPFQFTLMNWATLAKKGSQKLWQDSWYKYFIQNWQDRTKGSLKGASFDDHWVKILQDGVVDTTVDARGRDGAGRAFAPGAFDQIKRGKRGAGLELVLYPSIQVGDGTLANVSWLQELPDSISKVTWDNYLVISPKLAADKKLEMSDLVNVTVGNQTLKLPVFVQPGMHDEAVAIQVGYGRTAVGKVGNGIGLNAFPLARFNGGHPIYAGLAVSFEKTAGEYELASVQRHHHMEGRQIIVQATLAQYLRKKDANIDQEGAEDNITVWPKYEYNGYRWGMSIDHNSCIGCGACTTACQSENNIPVVGKKFVLTGREMHWIRIDRYYWAKDDSENTPFEKKDLVNPDILFQPMLCQHCENAPCETVCPVAATMHDDQGLNTMIYNRCVGTRYCSNNCPYKVRRFNWFNYNIPGHEYTLSQKPLKSALNPEVTVRFRGVMEKCTFCIQRIDEKKNEARNENRTIRDGEIKTACEQTCPTNAIVFGNMNDPASRVTKLHKDERTYGVLAEYNTKPSLRYMTRIRNANRPDLVEIEANLEEKGHTEKSKAEKSESGGAPAPEAKPKDSTGLNTGAGKGLQV